LPRRARAVKALLALLRELGEAYQADLVRASGLSKARVSEVLAQLTRQGLIGREVRGRNVKVYLRSREGLEARPKELRLGLVRAAEYPYIVPLMKLLKQEGFTVQLRVYDNGIDVMQDLSSHRLQLAIAPLLTFFTFYSLGAALVALAPAGAGGASVILDPRRRGQPLRAACTRLSTMEMLLATSVNHGVLPKLRALSYCSGPQELMRLLEAGRVDAVSIWEPYASSLVGRGYVREVRYSELAEHVCCLLGASQLLDEQLLERVSYLYARALDDYAAEPGRYHAPYSALVGLDAKAVEVSLEEYSHPRHARISLLERQLAEAGIRVPSPTLLQGMFLSS